MAFGYYVPVTGSSANSGGGGALSNFPIVIFGGDAGFPAGLATDLKTVANGGKVQSANGYDIRPYADSSLSTALNFELVTYNASDGTKFEMHVNCGTGASQVTSSADWPVYIALGDSGISSDGSSNTTWSSDYLTVLHTGDGTTVSTTDSSQSSANFTNTGSTPATAGQLGGGASFNGSSQRFSRANYAVPSTGTMSCWWNPGADPTTTNMIAFRICVPGSTYVDMNSYPISSVGYLYAGWYGSGSNEKRVIWTESGFNQGTWYHVVITWTNGGTTTLYVDGSSKGTTSSLNATWDTSGRTGYIGYDENAGLWFVEKIDEYRLSNVAKSAAWVTAERNNQKASQNLLSFGSTTAVGGGRTTKNTRSAPLGVEVGMNWRGQAA